MDEFCESIGCLTDSPQRFQILNALEVAEKDLRDLMDELDSPRTTLQRNLSVLEERGWIETTTSGYTTTTTGCLLREEFVAMSETVETIRHMAPFLDAVDAPTKLDVDQLNDPLVTVPESTQPHLPRKRLLTTFGEASLVRGFLPVISSMSVEHSRRVDDSAPECEYVVSSDGVAALRRQSDADDADRARIDPPAHITIRVYDGDLPYGLFVSDDALALTAYDEVGRIQAVVESTNEESIKWGEQVYEEYRQQSKQPHEVDIPTVTPDSGIAD